MLQIPGQYLHNKPFYCKSLKEYNEGIKTAISLGIQNNNVSAHDYNG